MLNCPPFGAVRSPRDLGPRAVLFCRFAWLAFLVCLTLLAVNPAMAAGPNIDDMTWTEVRDALHAGKTTVIIPVGGTEQSGAHMALGKHNVRVKVLAERIATELGNALVAPVIAYVPEGSISPPTQHMRYVGTVSISPVAFTGVVEGAARSFRQHGFVDVVLIGDHGGYQQLLAEAAARLNREAPKSTTRVHFVGTYYEVAQQPFQQLLREHGLTDSQIGVHAGAADTALMLAIDPALVRPMQPSTTASVEALKVLGVVGDPSVATATLGRLGTDLIFSRTVLAIRKATQRSH